MSVAHRFTRLFGLQSLTELKACSPLALYHCAVTKKLFQNVLFFVLFFIRSSDFHASVYKMIVADSQSGKEKFNYLVFWAYHHCWHTVT